MQLNLSYYLVKALKSSNTRKFPCTILLWIRRVAKLTSWSHSNLNFLDERNWYTGYNKLKSQFITAVCWRTYHNGITKEVLKCVPECPHEICITLDRGSSLEDWKVITTKWDILIVSPTPLISVTKIRVLVNLFNSPLWQRNPAKMRFEQLFFYNSTKNKTLPRL